MLRTNLAWKNLFHRKYTFLTALMGTTFATILILMQTGFYTSLGDSNVRLLRKLNADIIVTHKLRYPNMGYTKYSFPRERLYQIASYPEVEGVYPLYNTLKSWKNVKTKMIYYIHIFAFPPHLPVVDVDIKKYRKELELPGTCLVDSKSKKTFGPLIPGVTTELQRKKMNLIGTFEIGRSFFHEGLVIMSDHNYVRWSHSDAINQVHFGLVKVNPGVNTSKLIEKMRRQLPADLTIISKQKSVERELRFWKKRSEFAPIIIAGALIALFIGSLLVYQTLYSNVIAYYQEYATLKALGYKNSYFTKLVVIQALYIAILGFIPGRIITHYLTKYMINKTGMIMTIDLNRSLLALFLCIVASVVAGLMAIRKIHAAKPAEILF